MTGHPGGRPTVLEVSVAGLLHDIGKLCQRAHEGRGLPPDVEGRAHDILPQHQGRYSHKHALWSEWFFDQCGEAGANDLPWPAALDRARVRNLAVFHHAPLQDYRGALLLSELVTRADRLAAGQERKARDADAEETGEGQADRRRAYLETPLEAIAARVCLGAPRPARRHHLPAVLAPAAMMAQARPPGAAVVAGYRVLWQEFRQGWSDLCDRAGGDGAAFEEGLLSLSEGTLWAVPSSTVDEPDVSLHDHGRAVAAFAAALFRHHEGAGDLDDARALRDGARPKFRFLVGDLSGLQRTLFRLRSEGVPGLARVLRGRSLRFKLVADAAVRRTLDAFGMPMAAALQTAGGRFLLLLPHLAGGKAERRLDDLRSEFDDWFAAQYAGDLALGLALSDPFAPWDLMARPDEGGRGEPALARARAVRDRLGIAIETAKLRQLEGPAEKAVMALDYPAGECPVCGIRPAGGSAGDRGPCPACDADTKLGTALPRARAVVIGAGAEPTDRLLGLGYLLAMGEGPAARAQGRGWRWLRQAGNGPAPLRPGPAYVARHREGDGARCKDLARAVGITLDEDEAIEEGQIKSFQALALEATEAGPGRGRRGRPMLALLKGDVDRLGRIFAHGLGERWSVARSAQFSRMIDAYFSLRLPELLETGAPDSYTVYAGGDDFVLVLPWRQGFALAGRLAQDFRDFSGANPDLTLSLGIALFDPRTPVSIAVGEAEARLEAAKAAGRNRVSAVEAEAMSWEDFATSLENAERLNGWLRDGTLATAALHRLLALDDARRRIASGHGRPADFGWMGKLGYALARLTPASGDGCPPAAVVKTCRGLFGIGPDWRPAGTSPKGARLALTHALYRNR